MRFNNKNRKIMKEKGIFKSLVWCVLLVFYSCGQPNDIKQHTCIVNVRDEIDEIKGISLETQLSDPTFIKLEETTDEQSLVDGVADYAVTSKYIYILPIKEPRIVLFDRQGHFLRTLIKEGQGPDEFSGLLMGIQVDEANNRLYLFGSQIWVFSLDGDPIRTFSSSMPMMYARMIAPDRFAAVAMGFVPFQAGSFGIGTFNEQGDLLFHKNNFSTPSVPAEKTGFTTNIASGLSFDGRSVLFKSGANDTVFRIGTDTISVACVLRLENSNEEDIRALDISDFSDMAGLRRDEHEIFVQDILESSEHFYFRCRYKRGFSILSIRKSDGKTETEYCELPLPLKELSTLGTYQYGLLGMRGRNLFPVWGYIFGKELVQVITPAELMAHKDKGLIKLPVELGQIEEEGNPLIVFYNFQ